MTRVALKFYVLSEGKVRYKIVPYNKVKGLLYGSGHFKNMHKARANAYRKVEQENWIIAVEAVF